MGDPRWSQLQEDITLQNSRCDSRPNAAGSRIYAEMIVNELVRLRLLPASGQPRAGISSVP